MSRRAIRSGDATTTGGIVIAGTASIFVNNKHIALDGDKATCGNCEGKFPIAGSAVSVVGGGRAVAVEGDAVLCPCGQNLLVAGSDCTFFIGGRSHGAASLSITRSAFAPKRYEPASEIHDEQYVLREADSGRPLSNVRYRILLSSGKIFTGVTDATGHTQRVTSTYAESIKFEITRNRNAES
ncbi:PAAR domain-containing protein [Burkholderia metallica]|uniref:PAAR domain-containing protein n=1 Tax=Burkholderia metallica TaxID=488729 RepID=UPI00157B3FEC|nr:PAAR domain-containing protein [Burkholderia metallica]NTZ86758.1 PAAR domain-containing protein [Burkholderia metallica]